MFVVVLVLVLVSVFVSVFCFFLFFCFVLFFLKIVLWPFITHSRQKNKRINYSPLSLMPQQRKATKTGV